MSAKIKTNIKKSKQKRENKNRLKVMKRLNLFCPNSCLLKKEWKKYWEYWDGNQKTWKGPKNDTIDFENWKDSTVIEEWKKN